MSLLDTPQWPGHAPGKISYGEQPLELRRRPRRFQPKLRFGLRPENLAEIPYEPQEQKAGERTCGTAALAMVLHGLNVPCSHAELWSEIACPDGQGQLAARTFHLAAAALRRGIPALIIQVREPWRNLRFFVQTVPGMILNHRLESGSEQGHFTVLLDMNEESALIHDPLFGPRRLLSLAKLSELWQPANRFKETTEVAGHILVGMGPRSEMLNPCEICGLKIPTVASCGDCGQGFPLQPAALLGCMRNNCQGCRWDKLFCPFCDAAFQPRA